MIQKELKLKLKHLIAETVTMLCKNTLPFKAELTLEGLLGITLDDQEIVLVNLNETFADKSKKKANDDALVIPDSPPNSPRSNSSTPQRGTPGRTPDSGRRNRDNRVPPSPSSQAHLRQRSQQVQSSIQGSRKKRTNESIDLTDEMDLDVIVVDQREARNRHGGAQMAQGQQQQQPYPVNLFSTRGRGRKTILTPQQRACLEKAFCINNRPTIQDMAKIADELKLDREVVRTWFNNRRCHVQKGFTPQQQAGMKGIYPQNQYGNMYRPIRNAAPLAGFPRMVNPQLPNFRQTMPNQFNVRQNIPQLSTQQFSATSITPQQYNSQPASVPPVMPAGPFPQQQQQPIPTNNVQPGVPLATDPAAEQPPQYTAPANPVNVVKPVEPEPMETDYSQLTNTVSENAASTPTTETPASTTDNTGTLTTPPPVTSPTPGGAEGPSSTPSTPGSDKTIITGPEDNQASVTEENTTPSGAQHPDESQSPHVHETQNRATASSGSGSSPAHPVPDPDSAADNLPSTEADTLPVIGEILSLNKLAKISENNANTTQVSGPKTEPSDDSDQQQQQTYNVIERKEEGGSNTFDVVPSVKQDTE